jgi:hypothetical protein
MSLLQCSLKIIDKNLGACYKEQPAYAMSYLAAAPLSV